jgi:hypothetical protein
MGEYHTQDGTVVVGQSGRWAGGSGILRESSSNSTQLSGILRENSSNSTQLSGISISNLVKSDSSH